jgi:hypothetical protein
MTAFAQPGEQGKERTAEYARACLKHAANSDLRRRQRNLSVIGLRDESIEIAVQKVG